MTFLDGLPGESWYKISAAKFVEELKAFEENHERQSVRSLIYAQLNGQKMEVADADY